jgi:hypothetical protein
MDPLQAEMFENIGEMFNSPSNNLDPIFKPIDEKNKVLKVLQGYNNTSLHGVERLKACLGHICIHRCWILAKFQVENIEFVA